MNIGWDGSRIVIPINGVFNKYRRSPFSEYGPKYSYEAGATSAIFNMKSLEAYDTIVITEGEFDALCLESAGIHAVSSTGGSGTFEKEWGKMFENKTVYICYDNDEAGYRGAIRVKTVIPHAGIIELPHKDGIKDVTDFFMKEDRPLDSFVSLMAKAHFFSIPKEEDGNASRTLRELRSSLEDMLMKKRLLLNDGKSSRLIDHAMEYLNKRIEAYEYILKRGKKKNLSGETGDRIKTAKSVPITFILKFDPSGFAKCLWHTEKTASMHYYEKKNIVHCFSCDAHGDSIDVYRKLHNCSIKDAIDALTQLK